MTARVGNEINFSMVKIVDHSSMFVCLCVYMRVL